MDQEIPPAGGPASEIIAIAPVQLAMRASAKEMAKALFEYAQQLIDVAKQLDHKQPGQKFHITLVHRYQHGNCGVSNRSDCKGGVHVMEADCNGGGDGG
jgi:hypothetical protein